MDTLQAFSAVWQSTGIINFTVGQLVMVAVGFLLLYLGIKKGFEPLLLVPIGFGGIFANIPGMNIAALPSTLLDPVTQSLIHQTGGFIGQIYQFGIDGGLFPILIFIGIGALTDFGPLIARPVTALAGAGAQLGIFFTLIGALILTKYLGFNFTLKDAASIAIIGGADGPTSIFVASALSPKLLGSIAVAAYSYMALVPLILPPVMRLLTTKEERMIRMQQLRTVSKREKILFPLVALTICILLLPSATPLIGAIAFGNLLRESGVTDRLSKTAQNELINIVTILLGLAVGSKLSADQFLTLETIGILILGLIAFMLGSAGGILIIKLLNKFVKEPINPLIGAAGVSAVPMSARVVQRVGQLEDPDNYLLMHAMGPNVAGVIGSAVAAGILLALVPLLT
jgi:oxaloacetate decarboxylase beta subunit